MLKANCTLYRFSKKRLCFLNKKGLSFNLIDSNLVEYSTSQLKTHIRKKHHIIPAGHSETVLRRFEDWLIPILSHRPRRGKGRGAARSPPGLAAALVSAGHSPAAWTWGRLSKHFIRRHFKLSDFLLTHAKRRLSSFTTCFTTSCF